MTSKLVDRIIYKVFDVEKVFIYLAQVGTSVDLVRSKV